MELTVLWKRKAIGIHELLTMDLSIPRRWCMALTTDTHDRRGTEEERGRETRSWVIWASLGLDPDVAVPRSQKVVRRSEETQLWMRLFGTGTGAEKRTGSGSHWKLTEL
ncbi:hypothetical protein QR685DRAFT_570971 [Neurospora intermedia]|uniref:Uncharacterized protein n=1 Tax=Neurospora intermedia TaxID=5142 RepID=A0ABR3DI57_NEUIN